MNSTTPAWMKRVHVTQGFPRSNTDTAPAAAFIALYLAGAIANAFILIRNNKRGHKFIFNGSLVGFCIARIVTMCLRLGWIYNIENRGLAIAATIFVAAGVLVLFILNLMFAQRILRGTHPELGWHRIPNGIFLGMYALILPFLILVVTATTQSFFTTDKHIQLIDISLQRSASTYFMFMSILPIPIVLYALLKPTKGNTDHYGKGTWWHKGIIVIISSALLGLGAVFRTSVAFYGWSAQYQEHAPWWNSKWCFYFFNFTVEVLVVYMWIALRIDLVHHIPNGSKGPGSYSTTFAELSNKATPSQETIVVPVSRPASVHSLASTLVGQEEPRQKLEV